MLAALGATLAALPSLHAQPVQTQEQRELAQARENAKWEQAVSARRLDGFLKDEPGPARCQIFVEWSPRLYAIAAGPSAEQHGARRGDRIKAINGEHVATLGDVKRILSGMPAGVTAVDVVVTRRSRLADHREVPLSLPCVSDRTRWEARQTALQAMKAGRWSDCLEAIREVMREWGTGLSGDIEIRGLCAYYDARLKGKSIGSDDARSLYDWRHAQITEARYDPGALDRVRGDVLASANVLRAWNARNLGEDLEAQLKEAALRTRHDPDDESGHARGTGVLVRPDGTLLTAAHVVSGAKHIVVHCPGRKETVGRTDALARSLDLAVIKTGLGSTAYLTSSRSTRLGEPLFAIGFPISAALGSEPALTEGSVSALAGLGGEISYLQTSVPIQPGGAGGPLVNAQGQLVGIVSASADDGPLPAAAGPPPQMVNYAVKADYARPLFEQPPPRPPAASRMEAHERAKGATCRIEVDR